MTNAKVTMKPSEEIVAAAVSESTATDSRGRLIKFKKPGVLAQYRIVEALGDLSSNAMYHGMVLPLLYVVEIDGEPVMPMTSKRQIEALVQRLDEDGIEAVMKHVQETYGKSDPEKEKTDLKN